MAEQENTRLLILETLVDVEKKNIFVKDALHKLLYQKQFLSKQDRAFISRMVEGVTEYQVRLDYVINSFSKTKVNKCKPLIRCLLRMGVYQMLYMDSVPNEAACNECVKLAKKKGFHNLTGFVNGVLRNVARNLEHLEFPKEEDNVEAYLSVHYSMPQWLVEKMIEWYGVSRTKTMLASSVKDADLTIRVNTEKITKEALIAKLEEQDIKVFHGKYNEEALHLQNINYVNRIPGFRQGEFFVQDESSMLLYKIGNVAAEYDRVGSTLEVLDLCAAPGGKCTHFASFGKDKIHIDARDLSEYKISLIEENIERLGLSNITTTMQDALIPDTELQECADIVIADLPCSGLGIMSKKNDIKYHLKTEQFMELANLQRTFLANACEYVKPGGILLYSTCTINPEENLENAKWFLEHYAFESEDITALVPDELKSFMIEDNMLQLLPGEVECDGFFISKFRKAL